MGRDTGLGWPGATVTPVTLKTSRGCDVAARETGVGWPGQSGPVGLDVLASSADADQLTRAERPAVSRETGTRAITGSGSAGSVGGLGCQSPGELTGRSAGAPVEASPSAHSTDRGRGKSGVAPAADLSNTGTEVLPAPPAGLEPVSKTGAQSRVQVSARTPPSGVGTKPTAPPAAGTPRRPEEGPLPRERWAKPAATRVLTVANQKGGVGKTTTAVNLAAALAHGGLSVLVIDTDPQGNASTALGIDHHSEIRSVYDVLVDEATLRDVAQDCPDVRGLTCVPASIDLAGAEIELVSFVARETRLQRAVSAYLAEIGDEAPDYIFIDCPPSLGLLTINAFVAAREVLIPIQCEYYALEGVSMLLKNIEMIRRHLNPNLHISTILLTMYDARTRLSQQVAHEVRSHFPEQVLPTTVPRSVRISEAPSHGQTVLTYDPMSTGALSYLDAARELAARS